MSVLAHLLFGVTSLCAAADSFTSEVLHASLPEAEIRIVADRISYRGLITEQAYSTLLELYAAAQPKPTVLQIESRGGKSRAAIALGGWVFDHGLDVEIDTYCMSTCASYVFPAGARKLLAPHASLVWHGGATQPVAAGELERVLDEALQSLGAREREAQLANHSRAELLQLLEASLDELRTLETQLFDKLQVDQRITTLGLSLAPAAVPGAPRYCGWDYRLEDLRLLGVRNIQVTGGRPWEPRFPFTESTIYRVHLHDLPGFRPAATNSPTAAQQ